MFKNFILFTVLNFLDLTTTLIAIKIGLIEQNALMDMLIQTGPWAFSLVKVTIGLGCGLILYHSKSKLGFIICDLILLYAVVSNTIHIISIYY